MTTTTKAPVANLRNARKEQAAKKVAAPAKAPAQKPAEKVVAATNSPKLRWLVEGDRNRKGGKEQSAVVGDRTYAITAAGEAWQATVKVGRGKPTVLAEGTFGKAYTACVNHNKAQVAK